MNRQSQINPKDMKNSS